MPLLTLLTLSTELRKLCLLSCNLIPALHLEDPDCWALKVGLNFPQLSKLMRFCIETDGLEQDRRRTPYVS